MKTAITISKEQYDEIRQRLARQDEFCNSKRDKRSGTEECPAILERTAHTYRRSVNGAWCGAGCTTDRFEIPLEKLNSPEGEAWLNPSHECATVTFEDGDTLSIDHMNTPCRGHGFGPLGYITVQPTKFSEPRQELVSKPHSKLPNIARGYYGVKYFTDSEIATFKQLT